MGNKNSFQKKGLEINNLSKEDKEIINKIPHIEYTYICKYCKKIPKIEIIYNEKETNILFNKYFLANKKFIEKINFKECKHSTTLNAFQDYDDNDTDFFGLEKVSLDKLKSENFMNINKTKDLINPEKYLNFENMNKFNEYLNVYKSFLNIKDQIKEYNLGDTKNNKIFTLFENLLYIGFNGLGTKYEFENSIVIKEFTFDKFICYNKELPITNELHFINIRNITFRDMIDLYIISNELYGIKPWKSGEYNTKIYIVKYDLFLNKSFNVNEYLKYCRIDRVVPIELKKDFLDIPQTVFFSVDNIITPEENVYIVRLYNELIKYSFDETSNEYLTENISLENGDNEFQELILLKNNIIFILTINYIYFYSYNKENKNLNFVKKFSNVFGKKPHPKDLLNICYLKNGKTLFYYINSAILIMSMITLEIQLVVKFNNRAYIRRINEKLLEFEDFGFISEKKKTFFDIYKTKLFEKDRVYNIFNIDGQFLNNDIIISKGLNQILIKDRKAKNIEYINMGILEIFIFNKEENLFGLYIYDEEKYKLLIYKLK